MTPAAAQLDAAGIGMASVRPATTPGRFDGVDGDDFRTALERAATSADVRRAKAREAAEQLVATAFIQPMLATLRDSTFGAEMFEPGLAEQRFGPMFDQHMADRITQAAHLPLVDVITDRLVGRDAQPSADATARHAVRNEVIDVSA
jgi:Rod binding domain-containing protein